MKQRAAMGIYIGIIIIFVLICVLSIFELMRSNTFSKELRNISGNSSQTAEIQALRSALSEEQSSNSQLSSQFNDLNSKYQALQSSYDNLQSQVNKIQAMKTTIKGSKIAYLTFDDGPSSLTPKVLDILKANNIHATFFVVGTNAVNHPEYIKRAYNEGNVIGIHSWTHKYDVIYASMDNFFADFNKLKDYLTNLLGFTPNVCRYPGGTNNKMSLQYSDHIMRPIVPAVEAMGIKVFDWNSIAGDAETTKPNKAQVISNVMSTVPGHNMVVVLFHDMPANTADLEALPDIISRLRALGYTFDVLTPLANDCAFKPQ